MDIYASNTSITIDIDIVDSEGNQISPLLVHYRVIDESDNELIAITPVMSYTQGDDQVQIVIDQTDNAITDGSTRSARVVELHMTMIGGQKIVSTSMYVIQDQYLSEMSNTYQTLAEAEMNSMDMTGMDQWMISTDRDKTAALIEAYNRIGKLSFYVANDNLVNQQSILFSGGQTIYNLNSKTREDINAMPTEFVNSLKRAQVAEANVALGGDSIAEKRRGGLMSDTVGESSSMYRPGKPILLTVSRRTLEYLAGYVIYGVKLGRR